jgi:hypothetical protein
MLTCRIRAANRYFTVVHPWPGHLDLSLPGDGKQVSIYGVIAAADEVNNDTDSILDVQVASW